MKRINFIQIAVVSVILFFSSIVSFAQVAIPYGTAVIDGVIEDTWDISPSHAIDKPFQSERPTVTAYWKAMYDDDNFYVVVNVMDDNHWPGWESGGNSWEYDKPEVFWDWNEVLKDRVGASQSNSGHFQLADGFLENSYDVPITKVPSALGNLNPGGTYAYSLSGENYVYEMAVPFTNFYDKNGIQITKDIALSKAAIGFDVIVIDQDQGITTVKERTCWANNGAVDENWLNMDGAGTIQLLKPAPQKVSYQSVIRDANGELVKSGNVGIRISILQGSVTGTAVYVETHSVSTNINGLASLEVGNGTPVKGKFSIIDWSNGPYFLKTENDPKGGTNFIITGTSEILSTPYALYSDKAGIAEIAKTATTATSFVNPQWTKSGSNLTYNEGNVGIGTINPTSKLDVNGVVNVNNNKITNVATPTNDNDAVTKAYVDKLLGIIQTIQNGVTDVDGNHYKTVMIGSQAWMAENLNTKRLNDSTIIPLFVTDNAEWYSHDFPRYCWYNNDSAAYANTYGVLYNWCTVNTGKLCPTGWHVPSDAEWTTLENFLTNNGYGYGGSGNDIAKSMAATLGWPDSGVVGSPGNDQASNNSSGFKGLTGGMRQCDGPFSWEGVGGFWWSSTEYSDLDAFFSFLYFSDSTMRIWPYNKGDGMSVRCVKD